MKRLVFIIFSVLFVISLCSCSSSETEADSTYNVMKNGTIYVIDPVQGTISDDTHTYQYEIRGNSNDYSINITYPNGSTYWWQVQSSGSFSHGFGGWSDDYDENRYASGETLCDVLEEDIPKEKGAKNVLLILFVLIVGIFNTISPHTAWYLEYGWRYRNAEPSDLALGLNRLGGIIAIIAAVIMLFI